MPDMLMPKIVYGTAWKKDRTTDLVYTALKAGFRGVDTACQPKHYREDLVGEGVQRAIKEGLVTRDELWLQTKFTSIDGQDRRQPLPYDPKLPIPEQVKQSIARSLTNLGVTRIDSVVLHSPLRTREATLAAYRVLEDFVTKGTVGAIGVSNIYDADELAWLIGQATVPVSVVQNRWYQDNGWDWAVYDLCQKHGIRYQSFWTLTGSPALLQSPLVEALATSNGITPEQTVYRLCQLWNITPLCGSTSPTHIAEALAIENSFTVDEPAVKQLWSVMHGERP